MSLSAKTKKQKNKKTKCVTSVKTDGKNITLQPGEASLSEKQTLQESSHLGLNSRVKDGEFLKSLARLSFNCVAAWC